MAGAADRRERISRAEISILLTGSTLKCIVWHSIQTRTLKKYAFLINKSKYETNDLVLTWSEMQEARLRKCTLIQLSLNLPNTNCKAQRVRRRNCLLTVFKYFFVLKCTIPNFLKGLKIQ